MLLPKRIMTAKFLLIVRICRETNNKMSNIINIILLCGYFVATYVFLMGGYMHF